MTVSSGDGTTESRQSCHTNGVTGIGHIIGLENREKLLTLGPWIEQRLAEASTSR